MQDAEGFDKRDYPLHEAAVAQWEGFVLVNIADDPVPFDQAFAPMINRLERYRIGFTFSPPLEDQMVRFFETLTATDYDHIRHRLSSVPTSMFVADDAIDRLCTMLGDVTPQRG